MRDYVIDFAQGAQGAQVAGMRYSRCLYSSGESTEPRVSRG
jgi:coenzyme F420-reducing hydrogenase delta subunit